VIRIAELRFAVGGFRLELSLEIARGEYLVLMGPPGAGKTMLVECLAGLRAPSAGRIEIAGRDVTAAEPRDRGIGYVPQDYALFTTRSVYANIAFGPQVRGLSAAEVDRRVREAVRLLDIERLLERRRVQGLSGGERQRVALARALAVKPDVLILDEPVSALDESTRESVCGELRRLQRELGLTTVHISHNLEEAFSVADRGAVMQGGCIRQAGRLEELLRRPASEFVARFMRCENIFLGACRGPGPAPGTTAVEAAGARFALPGERRGQVQFVVRPENVAVERPSDRRERQGAAVIPVKLTRAVDRGAYVRLELDGPVGLVAHLPPRAFAELGVAEGAELLAVVRPEGVHVIPG
jgi:molybdate/tungstate transport system ATP-binding protein